MGVGASAPELAVAGRVASAVPDADVVNLSRVGARVADVPLQLERAGTAPPFDLALLLVGGNDILRGTPPGVLLDDTRRLLRRLPGVATRCVWLGPADVGIAPVWRLPLRLLMSRRTRNACRIFEHTARSHGVDYIGFHGPEHSAEFRREPTRYFASDGIHPRAEGYRYCYERLSRHTALEAAGRAPAGARAPLSPDQGVPI